MTEAIEINVSEDLHGRVWDLQSVFANDYYAESDGGSSSTGDCQEGQQCKGENQWNNTLILASKTKAGNPDKCVCLWKQDNQEQKAGSEYCPVMNIPQMDIGGWRESRKIDSDSDRFTWCVATNKQGNGEDGKDGKDGEDESLLCDRQTKFSLGVDEEGFEPITSQQQCQAYMEKNYPETEFTTYHETEDKVQCKGYTRNDKPTLKNIDPDTGWSTLGYENFQADGHNLHPDPVSSYRPGQSGYQQKAGDATEVTLHNGSSSFVRANNCTDGASVSWKRNFKDEKPSGWPGSCATALFDGTREDDQVINAKCQYPNGTIPTQKQAKYLSNTLDEPGHQALVTNYCFSPETNPANILPQYDSIPKALSSNVDDRDLCAELGKHSPVIYDQAAINYCTDVYDRYKDVKGFDFSKTGCQCIIDTKVNPDPGLISIVTSLETHPSCVWKPCLIATGGDQLAPVVNNLDSISSAYGSTTDQCPPLPTCSNILTVTDDSQQIDSGFNQNVQCDHVGGASECQENVDCPGDAICNTLGLCIDNCTNVECETGWICNTSTGQCQLQTDRDSGYSGSENEEPSGGGAEPTGTGISTTVIIIIIVVVVLILGGLIIFWLRKKKNQKVASQSVIASSPPQGGAYRSRRIY